MRGFMKTLRVMTSTVGFSLDDLKAYTSRLEQNDRLSITERYRGMSDDERRIDAEMKRLRLGKWNVDVRNGIQVYNASMYDAEMRGNTATGEMEDTENYTGMSRTIMQDEYEGDREVEGEGEDEEGYSDGDNSDNDVDDIDE